MPNNTDNRSRFGDVISRIEKIQEFFTKVSDFGKSVQSFVLLLSAFIGLLVTVAVFSVTYHERVQLILVGLNWLALFVLIFPIWKKYKIEFNNDADKLEYCKLLNIKGDEKKSATKKAEDNNIRVNKSVNQLSTWIIWYIVCLLIVYLMFFIDNRFWWEWWEKDTDSYDYWHRYCKIFEDVFNFLSAVFLYLGFKVLYNPTLDEENEPKKYYVDAIVVSSLFIFVYLVSTFFIIDFPRDKNLKQATINEISNITNQYQSNAQPAAVNSINQINRTITNSAGNNQNSLNSMEEISNIAANHKTKINKMASKPIEAIIGSYEKETNKDLLNLLGLFIGFANGLAMSLLFGRYISMEHLVHSRGTNENYNTLSLATIFILPIYALTQPLFGSFEIRAFGNPYALANSVFFVCFVGKIFFLLFTYWFMKERLIHYYLHLAITHHGIPEGFKDCFEPKSQNEPQKSEITGEHSADEQSKREKTENK